MKKLRENWGLWLCYVCVALQVIFVALQLTDVINWNWWFVFIPVMVIAAIPVGLALWIGFSFLTMGNLYNK